MRLAVQVRANLKIPHRLVVISDFPPQEFCSELEHLDLLTHFGARLRQLGGCWLRLRCFDPALEPVLGPRWAILDLDSLVVGDMTPLLDRPEPLVLYRSDSIHGQPWNGSFVLGGVGSSDIWTSFDPDTAPALIKAARVARNPTTRMGGPRGTDQAWLALCRGPDTPHVSAADGVLYWRPGSYPRLPAYARMVTFAGAQKLSNWRVKRYSPWVEDFYPGPKIDPAEPLPAGLAIEPVALPKQTRRRGVVALEREARRRLKIRGGREFAKV